jgi:hypothetical protein
MAAAGPPLVGGAAPGRRSGAAWRGLAGPYDDDGETAGSRLPRLDPASPGPDLRRATVGAPRATPVSLQRCLSRGRKSLCSLPGPAPPHPPQSDPRCAATGAPVATAVASGDGFKRRRRLPVASDKRGGGLASRPRWRRGAMVAQPGPLAWHRGGGAAAGRWREVWHRGGACDNPPRKIPYCRLKPIHNSKVSSCR